MPGLPDGLTLLSPGRREAVSVPVDEASQSVAAGQSKTAYAEDLMERGIANAGS